MRYLVDTDWLIDALAGIPSASSTLERLSPSGVAVSVVSLGELYEGVALRPDFAETLERYREFLEPFPTLPLTEPIMLRFARVRAQLRQTGALIPDIDRFLSTDRPGERHGVVGRLAQQLGIGVESLRNWVRQTEVDHGER